MKSLIVLAALAASETSLPKTSPSGLVSYPATYFAAAQPTSAMDMVKRLPGFTFDAGGAVRGFAGAAGNVLVDGARPASKDDGLDDLLARIPATSVLRIDVILGGAPGIDMQGKTVLANVVRRRDAGGKLTVNASATHGLDSQISGNLLIDGETRVGDASVEGSLRVARFLDPEAGSGAWARAGSLDSTGFQAVEHSRGAEETYKATGSIESPWLGGKILVNGSITIDPYAGGQSDALTPGPGLENDRYSQNQDGAELGVRYAKDLKPGLSLETFLLQRLGRQTNTDAFQSDEQTAAITGDDASAYFNLRKTTGESIARGNVNLQAARTLSFQFGAEGAFNWVRTHTLYVVDGIPTLLPAADVDVTELRGEMSVNATWRVAAKITAEVGLRGEGSHISSSGDVASGRDLAYPKPRLTLSYSPDMADQLRFRVEREVGQLDFDDFTAQAAGLNTGTVHAGNPTLNPAQDWVLEAAWERRFWAKGDATITIRRFWLDDVVDRVGVSSPSGVYDAPGNIGAGSKDEIDFTLTLPLDRLALREGQLTGELTARSSRVTDPTTAVRRDISGVHPSDWSLHYTQGLARLRASWGFDLYGPWSETFYRFDEIDRNKLKASLVVFAEYKPNPDVTLKFEYLNPVGQGFEHSRQIYSGPRNIDALAFTDIHNIRLSHFLRLRITKTFP